ncbi:YcxB family protein [Mucilaginibacter sp. X5P1]|uniref:YcxB family protein n=1 Tax=Mucilaginibacter sp. X5P1 TaxID=2723088 RepID=UPI001621B14C|nr:YcxB family protein [Mucilaginibacter sp. X5P1]MBB6141309.1 hypothetical protein [Mucilaginibacter sp. X5P1]
MDPITFSTKQDYKTYLSLSLKKSYQNRTIWIFIFFLGFTTYQDFNITHDISNLIVFSAFVIILIANPYIAARNRYKSTPNADEELFWKIDDTGIEIKSKSSLTWTGWDSIIKFSENNQCFFIWFNSTQNTYFPKKAVSEKELYEIKKLMFVNGKKGL